MSRFRFVRPIVRTAAVAAVLALAACGGGAPSEEPLSMEIPRPDSFDGMDADVARLVQSGIAIAEKEPQEAQPRVGLGMIYHANEMFDLARTAYRQALSLQPGDARMLYHLARVEERTLGVEAAIETMTRSIEIEPGYAPSYWRRGGWLLRSDRLEEAEADFREAIEIAPDDPAGPQGLARVLIAQERAEEALPLLTGLLEADDEDPLTHLLLGNAYRALGRLEEAKPHLEAGQGEQVVREDPWTASDILRFKLSFGGQMQMAVTLLGTGQTAQAIEVLERLRPRNPEDARLLRQLGSAYIVVGRTEEGLATLDEGVRLHPDDPKLLNEAAQAHHVTGDSEGALALLDRALEIQPENDLALARRGVILKTLGRLPEAAVSLRAALVHRPQDTKLMMLLGDTFTTMRQYEFASAAYQNVLGLKDDDPEVYSRLAFVQYRLGRLDGAKNLLDRAIEMAGDEANPRWVELREEVVRLQSSEAGSR